MKKMMIITLTFLLLLISSCSYPSDNYENIDDDWFFETVEKVIKNNVKGTIKGSTYNISLNKLIDDKVNPEYNTWERMNMYPLKEYKDHCFEDIAFKIYADSSDYVLMSVLIEDEIIEYDIEIEEVYNEETGETTFIEHKTETGRHTDIIDLTDGGKKIKLNGTKGKNVDFFVSYVINDYSASTAFTIVLTDLNGNYVNYNWGIDDLEIVVSKIEE